MRGLWYVFRGHDGIALYQVLADAVMEVMHGPGGWLVLFKRGEPKTFVPRRVFSTPYLSKRVMP